MANATILIQGMTCSGCVNSVTRALESIEGVETVVVSLEQNQATVSYNEQVVNEDVLKNVVEEAGYDVA